MNMCIHANTRVCSKGNLLSKWLGKQQQNLSLNIWRPPAAECPVLSGAFKLANILMGNPVLPSYLGTGHVQISVTRMKVDAY